MSAGDSLVVAHPNIALAKYWGKCEWPGNYPAVPSLSVTLEGMATRTRVTVDAANQEDVVVLNGTTLSPGASEKARELLRRVRSASGAHEFARVESVNDFPTGSGLASSASGFAALALAAVRAYGLDWDVSKISDLARKSSASAARSLFGGFAELAAGTRGVAELSARPVAPASHLPLRVLVCVATESAKSTSSTSGMTTTAQKSPYFKAWCEEGPRLFAGIREALLARDFATLGELSEASALAMHASALAAGVSYFSGVTLEALAEVRRIRSDRVLAFATIDAGPHVKVLVREEDAPKVLDRMAKVPGVLRVIETRPGGAAHEVPTP